MRIVIPGGSGQIGTILARAFQSDGHDVVVLSRQPQIRPWRVVPWDGTTLDAWQGEIDGSGVVINLAGRTVNCRYNAANRHEILHSRIASTRVVGEAIAGAKRPPDIWLQAGTATIYAHRYDAPNDEQSGVLGGHESTRRAHGGSALMWRRRGSAHSTTQGRRRPGRCCSALR
jgi:NAD dependent epimerase/dehydratase family enzyme